MAGLKSLGVDDCSLIGHSLGGAIATAVAERSMAVTSLALLAPAGFGPLRLADLCALPGLSALTSHALPIALAVPPVLEAVYLTFVANGHRPSRELVARTRDGARRVGPGARFAVEALARCGHGSAAFFHRRLRCDGPVAALWGSRDRLVPVSHADGLSRALPHAHVEVWSGMGHHPQHERPAALARFVEEWSGRLAAPPARACRQAS